MTKYPAKPAFREPGAAVPLKPRLRSLDDMTRDVRITSDLAVAFGADRPELLKLIPPGPCDADRHAMLIEVITVMMETNRELRIFAKRMIRKHEALASAVQALGEPMQTVKRLSNDLTQMAVFPDNEADDA